MLRYESKLEREFVSATRKEIVKKYSKRSPRIKGTF